MAKIDFEDTIAAIATPLGEGGISVIRVSGSEAYSVVSKVFKSSKVSDLNQCDSHTIHLGKIVNLEGVMIDQALVSLFKAPQSYTGEDVIEISSHGGLVVTRRILDALLLSGARQAEPGEFTRRAFLSGKIDLTQAEAVLDLIKAKSDLTLDMAARQLMGSLSKKLKELKGQLMNLYAHLEAYVDFPEDDIEVYDSKEFDEKMIRIAAELEKLAASFKRGSLLREGVSIVIVGSPNVGKSSLFNTLLERDRAIVSAHEGTTRDCLEENIEVKGMYSRIIDTAGLAVQAKDALDKMGMDRTREAIKQADIFLYIVDGSRELNPKDHEAFEAIPSDKPVIVLINKSDLPKSIHLADLEALTGQRQFLAISSLDGDGLEFLEKNIADIVDIQSLKVEGEQVTRLRHKIALESALESLRSAQASLKDKMSLECVVVDLKASLDSLSELIGEVYSEDLLDVIFQEFCIGK